MRYACAIIAALTGIAFRLALNPLWHEKLPFITLFPAVMLSAWLGGLGPGIATTAISAAAAGYFWITPTQSWWVTDASDWLGLVVFVAVSVVISALNESWRRAHERRQRPSSIWP